MIQFKRLQFMWITTNNVTPATKLERTKNFHVFTEVYTIETYTIRMLYKISILTFWTFVKISEFYL
jgi:hypothetical protein